MSAAHCSFRVPRARGRRAGDGLSTQPAVVRHGSRNSCICRSHGAHNYVKGGRTAYARISSGQVVKALLKFNPRKQK